MNLGYLKTERAKAEQAKQRLQAHENIPVNPTTTQQEKAPQNASKDARTTDCGFAFLSLLK